MTKRTGKDPNRYFDDTTGKRLRPLVVSDHALLRYLERFCGIDVEEMRQAMTDILTPAADAKATSVSANGMTFKIRENTVVTVQKAKS